jgi:hypothetical protein
VGFLLKAARLLKIPFGQSLADSLKTEYNFAVDIL